MVLKKLIYQLIFERDYHNEMPRGFQIYPGVSRKTEQSD